MIDYNTISQRKQDVALRLRTAFFEIRKRNIPRLNQKVFEDLAVCVTPALAYDASRDGHLPFGYPRRTRTQHDSKIAVVFHEAHQAVVLYWELIRTDETVGLDSLLDRVEYYAEHGFRTCDILGSAEDGYSLCRPTEAK